MLDESRSAQACWEEAISLSRTEQMLRPIGGIPGGGTSEGDDPGFPVGPDYPDVYPGAP